MILVKREVTIFTRFKGFVIVGISSGLFTAGILARMAASGFLAVRMPVSISSGLVLPGRTLLRPVTLPLSIDIEKHHIRGLHLGGLASVTVLVFLFIRPERPLKVHLRAFLKVFVTDLSETAPSHDVVPFGPLNFVALLVGVRLVGCKGHIEDRRSILGVPQIRGISKISDESDFVDAFSHDYLVGIRRGERKRGINLGWVIRFIHTKEKKWSEKHSHGKR